MAAAAFLWRMSSRAARLPCPLLPSVSLKNPFALDPPVEAVPSPGFPSGGSMDLMAVPKKKVSRHKKGLRNGPKALKPVPVIVRCKSCGRVRLPHFAVEIGEPGILQTSVKSNNV